MKTNTLIQKLGCKIRITRIALGYTQENMADMLNMSVSGYAKIERGETDVSFSKIQKIAEILQTNIIELIDFERANHTISRIEIETIIKRIELLENELYHMKPN